MLKNKTKLLALITAFTISAGLITPVKSVKADEINVEAVHNIESITLNEDEKSDDKSSNKVIEILSFNDFHGNVLESGKNIGAAKLTGIIKEYQKKEPEKVETVSIVKNINDIHVNGTCSIYLEILGTNYHNSEILGMQFMMVKIYNLFLRIF